MGGIDNGSLQGGIFAQAKLFGSILRGYGPPVPAAGVVGDLYLDTLTWFLYEKRSNPAQGDDPWGHYIFAVPAAYQPGLKWFSAAVPTNDLGVTGDYCLAWSGFGSYGAQPYVYGPKTANGWPENGDSSNNTMLDPAYAGSTGSVGLVDESNTVAAFSSSTQLIVAGLANDEYVLSTPVAITGGTSVLRRGLRGNAAAMAGAVLNATFTATDISKA